MVVFTLPGTIRPCAKPEALQVAWKDRDEVPDPVDLQILIEMWARSTAAQAFAYRSTGSLAVVGGRLRERTIVRRSSPALR